MLLCPENPVFAWSFPNGPRLATRSGHPIPLILQDRPKGGRGSTGLCRWPPRGHMATSVWVVPKEISSRTPGEKAPVCRAVGGCGI